MTWRGLAIDPEPRGVEADEPVDPDTDRRAQRRIGLIWGLLLFNTLVPTGAAIVVLPKRISQVFTMGALGLAIVLALSLNRRLLIRRNLVLALFSVLALAALMTSVRDQSGVGAVIRSGRFLAFVGVLWLLSPWWGRRDLLLARCHLRALVAALTSVVLGALVAPGTAFTDAGGGRLGGAIWPIWPTAVAHFAVVAAGIAIVGWLSGNLPRSRALIIGVGGLLIVLLTKTRVALIGLSAGLVVAGLSLFLSRRRVRRVVVAAVVVLPLAALVLLPGLVGYLHRGETTQTISNLNGRKQVWEAVLHAPRSTFTQWFGAGLSDNSFGGKAIDSSWLAMYQDQGRVGLILLCAILLTVIVAAILSRPGAARAVALFIVVFCLVDGYTEVGLGNASPYLLDLAVAASVLVAQHRQPAIRPGPAP